MIIFTEAERKGSAALLSLVSWGWGETFIRFGAGHYQPRRQVYRQHLMISLAILELE
jgi:hypothetical protein